MRLLITGGAGFIGSHFVRMAMKSKSPIREILVLDALTYSGNLNNLSDVIDDLTFIQGNILDKDLVHKVVNQVDAIINFAAESHVDRSINSPNLFSETNFIGTQNLLDAATRKGIDRFLQVSTDEVYGSIENGSWDERNILIPSSPYSASKASADLLAMAYFKTFKLPVSVSRCSNNYGPNQFPEKLIPRLITKALEAKNLPIYGDGNNRRDWLHVEDHCRGLLAILERGRPGEIYNIGGESEYSNLEVAKLILNQFNDTKIEIEFVKDRPGHDFRYSVNYSKIANELDYRPTISFETGLPDTIEWYRKSSSWWKPLVS